MLTAVATMELSRRLKNMTRQIDTTTDKSLSPERYSRSSSSSCSNTLTLGGATEGALVVDLGATDLDLDLTVEVEMRWRDMGPSSMATAEPGPLPWPEVSSGSPGFQ
jgi:hypothetical protein